MYLLANLFTSYCMSWYGCQIWHLSSKEIDRVATSWNIAVKKVWRLLYNTHRVCLLLPYIMSPVDTGHAQRTYVEQSKYSTRASEICETQCARARVEIEYLHSYEQA